MPPEASWHGALIGSPRHSVVELLDLTPFFGPFCSQRGRFFGLTSILQMNTMIHGLRPFADHLPPALPSDGERHLIGALWHAMQTALRLVPNPKTATRPASRCAYRCPVCRQYCSVVQGTAMQSSTFMRASMGNRDRDGAMPLTLKGVSSMKRFTGTWASHKSRHGTGAPSSTPSLARGQATNLQASGR